MGASYCSITNSCSFPCGHEPCGEQGHRLNIPLVERYRVWFILFYSLIVGALVLLVAWLFRANRRESRKRIHAQTRLLIQHRLVEQRDEFDNIFCSIRDGLITYDTDLRIHLSTVRCYRCWDFLPRPIRPVSMKGRWPAPF